MAATTDFPVYISLTSKRKTCCYSKNKVFDRTTFFFFFLVVFFGLFVWQMFWLSGTELFFHMSSSGKRKLKSYFFFQIQRSFPLINLKIELSLKNLTVVYNLLYIELVINFRKQPVYYSFDKLLTDILFWSGILIFISLLHLLFMYIDGTRINTITAPIEKMMTVIRSGFDFSSPSIKRA